MSRSGYTDDNYDYDQWATIRWRGAVESALRGKRGQKFLRELITALDALPKAELVSGSLATPGGEFCALGAVGRTRNLDMSWAREEEDAGCDISDEAGHMFGIARAMAGEIMWLNDEGGSYSELPRARWQRMRNWAVGHLKGDL